MVKNPEGNNNNGWENILSSLQTEAFDGATPDNAGPRLKKLRDEMRGAGYSDQEIRVMMEGSGLVRFFEDIFEK